MSGTPSASAAGLPSQSSSAAQDSVSGTPSAPSQDAGSTTAAAPNKAPGWPLPGLAGLSHSASGTGKTVALTFDDGPDPRWTPQILALLAQHNAKATLCEIGPNAQRYPDLTKAIVAAGHRLCDHSVHHNEQQSKMPLDYNTHEIVDAKREITDAAGGGTKLLYYRAPGGDFSPVIRGIAAQQGLRPLGWSVDSDDWQRPGVDSILNNINKDLKPGAVVLMHDGGGDRSQSVAALARLLDQLDAQGYTYTFPER
ncbi:polysaccharide deacetylase family protein [Streptomyces sp. NPDC094438]|uniref:polysaccharide deacetylase family protein n=1 Tax=Streptomyces sp. NPDC094438 TaxID=3366061 RepID=UPI00381034BB